MPASSSGGQQQRLLLAIALVNDPAVLFLDEPTTGLDPQARRNFWELMQSIKARRKTIILTTHYMEEAELLCDEVVIMDRGRIIAQGPPRRLLHEHFAEVLLELPRQEFPAAARALPLNIIEASDRWRSAPTTWKPRCAPCWRRKCPSPTCASAGQSRGPVPGTDRHGVAPMIRRCCRYCTRATSNSCATAARWCSRCCCRSRW